MNKKQARISALRIAASLLLEGKNGLIFENLSDGDAAKIEAELASIIEGLEKRTIKLDKKKQL